MEKKVNEPHTEVNTPYKKHPVDKFETDIKPVRQFKTKRRESDLFLNDSAGDSSGSSINNSVLEEYWEDFDEDNNIVDEKKDFKFIDLEKLLEDSKQGKKLKLDFFNDFDPDNPPLLKHYDELKSKYKLPSRKLLVLERDGYRQYIKMLKKVNKVLVKRAKQQARDTAKRVLLNHTGSSWEDFDKEIGKNVFIFK